MAPAAPAKGALASLHAMRGEVERLVRQDARAALRLVASLESAAARVSHPLAPAIAARARADALLFLGRFREALAVYERAIRAYGDAGDTAEAARTALGKVSALMYLSRHDEALRAARAAERTLARSGDRVYLGRLAMNTGNLYFHKDRYAEALRHYRRARGLLRATSGRDQTVVGLEMNEASISASLGDAARAEKLLAGAIARAREMGWASLAAQGAFNLANVLFYQSRFGEALALLAEAEAVFEREDRSMAAIADGTRAEIYLRLNMLREAVAHAEAALGHFRKSGMRFDAAVALSALGVALERDGRPLEAEERLVEALTFFRAEGNRVREAAADLALARLAARRGAWADARARAGRAERLLASRGLAARAGLARTVRAEIELSAGRPAAARRLLAGAPRPPDALGRFERSLLDGRLAEAAGRFAAAMGIYRRAAARGEALRSALVGDEQKVAAQSLFAEVSERAVSLLAPRGPAAIAETFAFVERARARALADLLEGLSATRSAARRPAGTSRALLDEATRRLSWCAVELEREELSGDADPARRRRLARLTAHWERRIALLHRKQGEREGSDARGGGARGRILTLDAAKRLPARGEIVVAYFAARGALHAFRIERGAAEIVSLGTPVEKVLDLAERLRFQIDAIRLDPGMAPVHEARLLASATRLLEQAHARLIAPLGAIPEGSRLVVVPHGAMHRLPFGAFSGPDGALAERAAVSWAPSLSALAAIRARPRSRRPGVLVGGFADRLAPEIGREIESVGRALMPLAPRVEPAISSDEFLAAAPRARLIHLATHARFRDDNPLFSAVRLSDRWVHLYEILNLELDADLVVLSGCETGGGTHLAGDEVLGLARGFLARGARRLVVSLWPVDDRTAAALITGFHEECATGAAPAAALRRAALRIRAVKPHPYHWAPFTLVGESA